MALFCRFEKNSGSLQRDFFDSFEVHNHAGVENIEENARRVGGGEAAVFDFDFFFDALYSRLEQ